MSSYLIGITIVSVITFLLFQFRAQREQGCRHISYPKLCRSLIAGQGHGNRVNKLSQFLSRALPNQRLRIAFGIDNAFTSDDEVYVKSFVRHAERLINLTSAEWITLSDVAKRAVRNVLTDDTADNSPQVRIKLTSLIQVVSLRVILHVLYGVGKGEHRIEEGVKNNDLLALAEEINRVWIASKMEDTIPRFDNNDGLRKSLFAIFPGQSLSNPRENPLNLILPAFETLWRITLRTVIEIRFTTGRQYPEWQDLVVAFSQEPTKKRFELASAAVGGNLCVGDLVSEALRLYPPTRRVHRAYKWTVVGNPVKIAADLEACHTAREIWGSDAEEFKPARWTVLTQEQMEAYLPFGSMPFVCPARSVFGPRMIALLVGGVISELQGEWWLHSDDVNVREDLVSGMRLSTGREAYGDVFLLGSHITGLKT